MSLLDDLKSKADSNGDGKVTSADLEDLKQTYGDHVKTLDDLKTKADTNGDGKVDLNDAKGAFGNLGETLSDLKGTLFGK